MDWPEWSSHTPIKSISRCPLSSTISIFSDNHPSSPHDRGSRILATTGSVNDITTTTTTTTTTTNHLPGLEEFNITSSSLKSSLQNNKQHLATSNGISTSGRSNQSSNQHQFLLDNDSRTNRRPLNNNEQETDDDETEMKGHEANEINYRSHHLSSDSTHLNASSHLLELQKEIKEEEDEIFADINSAINSHSNFQDQSTFLDTPSSLADTSLSLNSTTLAVLANDTNSNTCTTTTLFESSTNTFKEQQALHHHNQSDHHHQLHTQDTKLDSQGFKTDTNKNTTIRPLSIYQQLGQSDHSQQNHHHILYNRAARSQDSTVSTNNSEGNTSSSSSSSTKSNSSGISDCFNSKDDATSNEDKSTNASSHIEFNAQSIAVSKTSSYFSNNPHHPLASASVATALSIRPNLIKSSSYGLNNSNDGISNDSAEFNITNKEEASDQHQSILLKFGADVAHLTNQWWSENDGSSRESHDGYNIYPVDDDGVVYNEEDVIVNDDNYDPNTYHDHQHGSNDMEDQMAGSYIDHQDPNMQNYPTSNLPKPCVFFLEGNCRRSDCKYSHDLSNITCKYWIEGFCFKGELCPFLHSYNMPAEGQDDIIYEDGTELNSNHTINPTFTIESEADFPSLPLDAPVVSAVETVNVTNIKEQILKVNPAVVFKMAKKKRKRG